MPSKALILQGQAPAGTTLPSANGASLFANSSASVVGAPSWVDNAGLTHILGSQTGGFFYNVQDFNILPANSASTNSTNIATLLAAAPNGSTIFFPAAATAYQFASAIAVGA